VIWFKKELAFEKFRRPSEETNNTTTTLQFPQHSPSMTFLSSSLTALYYSLDYSPHSLSSIIGIKPRILFLSRINCSPCSGLFKRSATMSDVLTYSTLIPCSSVYCLMKKYLMLRCLILFADLTVFNIVSQRIYIFFKISLKFFILLIRGHII
jgi:hypothetical protein